MGLVSQGGGASATRTSNEALPMASAYFLNASGSDGGGETEMVIWVKPRCGTWLGLMDYASNANVEKWLKEKCCFASQSQCAIPAGIFAKAQGAMLRGMAYGQELNLAHPPRPADKRVAWEPEWTAKVRVKSLTMVMLGDETSAGGQRRPQRPGTSPPENPPAGTETPRLPSIPGLPDVGKALKGLFGS